MESIPMEATEGKRARILEFLTNSAVVFVSRIFGAGIAFATQILMARWMGADQLGIYVFAVSWCIMISNLAGLGFPYAAIRFIGEGLANDNRERVRGFVHRGTQIVMGTSLLVAAIGVGLTLLPYGIIPADHAPAFRIAMLSVPILALIRLNSELSNAFSWFVLTFLPNTALRPLFLLIGVFLVWRFSNTLSASAAMLANMVIMLVIAAGQLVFFRQALTRIVKGAQPEFQTGLWVRTGASLLIITMLTAYFPEVNIIVAGPYLSADERAIYYACFKIALLIMFGMQAIDAVTLPRIARLYAEKNAAALQRLVAGATQLKFWAAAGATLFFGVFGKYFLLSFGSEFTTGHEALMILAATQLFIAAVGPVDELLIITGHQKRCVYVFGVAFAMMALMSLLLVPRFGINGAALAALTVTITWTVWLHVLVVKLLNIHPSVLSLASLFR